MTIVDKPDERPIRWHMDEARNHAIEFFRKLIDNNSGIEKAVLIEDIFGWLRAVIWLKKKGNKEALSEEINAELKDKASPYWSEEIFYSINEDDPGYIFYQTAWDEGVQDDKCKMLRIADRYRSRGSWFHAEIEPPWEVGANKPPILVFYSFKGGVGRSTALAAFAIQRARMGEKIAVIDFDLDAPGVGVLLAADEHGTTAPWGALDYMLERPHGRFLLDDYLHVCRREKVTGGGEIFVFPAAQVDDRYLSKLSRMDFEPPATDEEKHPMILLLEQIREEINPSWLLIDSRAGLSEPAGFLLGGLAHLYVLFGTTSEQSWQGIRLIIKHLGGQRVIQNRPQLDCLLVQAMVTSDKEAAESAIKRFIDRSEEEFRNFYYAPNPDNADEDSFWYIRDIDDIESPHYPLAIHYHQSLAHFDLIDKVADDLNEQDYKALVERIARKFGKSEN
jgi:hypothetical protein